MDQRFVHVQHNCELVFILWRLGWQVEALCRWSMTICFCVSSGVAPTPATQTKKYKSAGRCARPCTDETYREHILFARARQEKTLLF